VNNEWVRMWKVGVWDYFSSFVEIFEKGVGILKNIEKIQL
jgi:hypothetical protein